MLVRLMARDYRTRWGRDAHEGYRRWVATAPDAEAARSRAFHGTWDAVRTLVRTRRDAGSRAVHGLTGGAGKMGNLILMALRRTVREFGRRPVHSVVVVGTIAIAVGVNAALFTTTQTLLLRSLPFDDPERVGTVRGVGVTMIGPDGWAFTDEFLEIRGIAEAAYYTADGGATLTGTRNRRVRLAFVSPEFFDVLGVTLALGPGMREVPAGSPVAVLGYGMWQRDFAADRHILDRDVVLNGRSFRVVGVAPPEVAWPAAAEVWLGYPVAAEFIGGAYGAMPLVRVAPGVDLTSIDSELGRLQEAERQLYQAAGFEWPAAEIRVIRDELVGDLRAPMLTLFAAAGLVLLLGALNLASVWLHRVLERESELRTRRALGASRLRLVAQLTAEVTCLSFAGGLAALGVAAVGTRVLAARLPSMVPGVSTLGLRPGTVAVVAGLALGVGLVIGGVAAVHGSTAGVAGSRAGRTRSRARIEFALLAGQTAVASVLVATSIIAVRSLGMLSATPLGFDPDGTLAFTLQIPEAEADGGEAIDRYISTIAAELGDLRRVDKVGWTDRLPFAPGMFSGRSYRVRGRADTTRVSASSIAVSDDYFSAAGLDVLAGRGIGPDWTPDEVVIDRELAASLFAGSAEQAVGKQLEYPRYDGGVEQWEPVRVRGVVESQRVSGARSEARATAFRRLDGRDARQVGFLLRVRGNPSTLRDDVAAAVRSVNPAIVPDEIRSLRTAADDVLSTDRTLASILTGFAVAGLLLAALGLYGVTARQVAGRRRELGVRLALGASPSALVATVTRRGIVVGGVAVVFAMPGVLLAWRALEDQVAGGMRLGPWTVLAGAATVLLVTTVSAWIPARRVARISPRDALMVD